MDSTIGSNAPCLQLFLNRQASNRVYEKLAVAHHSLAGQHLLSGAFHSVAILELEFAVAQFVDADVGFAAGAQRSDLRAEIKHSRGVYGDHGNGLVERHAYGHELGDHGGQIEHAAFHGDDGQVGADGVAKETLSHALFG